MANITPRFSLVEIFYFFRLLRLDGTWKCINDILKADLRIASDRKSKQTATILDRQSVKTTETPRVHGCDAAKKIKGIKRHILVDTIGLFLIVVVQTVNIQNRDGVKLILEQVKDVFPRLEFMC
jgi:putative transposase